MAKHLPDPDPTDDERDAFDRQLDEARQRESEIDTSTIDGKRVAWAPQAGSQTLFMSCPLFEALYHGTRGPGKSDGLLMAYAQYIGRGFGQAWRGLIFRRTYPELADIVAKSEKWFRQIFPEARFNRARMSWEWPDGEAMHFRHILRPEDYWKYHGHENPFIGFEELTNWATDECYLRMFSCCRSAYSGHTPMPRVIRSTSNPYGIGTNWIKERFRLHGGRWRRTVIIDDAVDDQGEPERPRCAIHGHIDENKLLLAADPHYKQTIAASATNKAMREAWLDGSWDIMAGGMFDDVWSHDHNDIGDFEVPPTWRIDRGFDWGSSKPFSVGWYATSDGSDLILKSGRVLSTVRGDLFRIREWYGWTGRPNEGQRMLAVDIAKGIVERELMWGWRDSSGTRVRPGPADSAIFKVENGMSVAHDMAKPVRIDGRVYPGVKWLAADKSSGSRVSGWEFMRKMMAAAKPEPGLPRENPGLFIIGDRNPEFLRTVLSAPRDEKNPDDLDTKSEDHIADEVRYRCRAVGGGVRSGKTTGHY